MAVATIPGPDWQTEFDAWLAPFLDRLTQAACFPA